MARKFHRPRTSHPIADLNVTNLIDLGFMLLIIFMVVANPTVTEQQKIPVNLPIEAASTQQPPDKTQRTESITVLSTGNMLLGDSPMTLRQLSVKLAAFGKEPKPPIIELRLDAKCTTQQWIDVMAELKKHNLTKIAFPTQVAK